VPFEKDDPGSPLNRRISIIVMNREAEDRFFNAARAESEVPAEGIENVESVEANVDTNSSRPATTGR
jgi:chemotaxis protein MotB